MYYKLLQFEWNYHSRQTSFIVFAVLFLTYGVLSIAAAFQYLEGSTMYNDAYNLNLLSAIISIGAIFPAMFFSINGALRDATYRSEEITFSTGLKKVHFFATRFLGVFLSTLLIATISLFGVFVGTLVADLDPLKLHVFELSHYLWSWLTIMVPNIFICSAILFSITLLSRNVLSTYLAGLFVLTINWISGYYINSPIVGGSSLSTPEVVHVFSLLDLLGLAAFFEQVQFLSPIEKNEYLMSFSGHFLWNRVIWLAISTAIISTTYHLFSFRRLNQKEKKESRITEELVRSIPYSPIATTTDSFRMTRGAFASLVKLELKSVIGSMTFLILLVMWAVILFITFNNSIKGGVYGAKYPTTDLLLGFIMEILPVLGLLLIVFYSGELVWKTRASKFHEIIDSTPTVNGVFFASKLSVLVLIPLLLILTSILAGIAFQAFNGYFDFRIPLYLTTFYYSGIQFMLYAVFALLIQAVLSNKYLGMIVSGMVMLIFGPLSAAIGLEHPLFLFNHLPSMARAYSDFVGYGQFIAQYNWFAMYWSSLAGVLVLFTYKFWKRGAESSFNTLFSHMWSEREKVLLGGFLVLFNSIGGFIYYQINVVNEYLVADQKFDFNENYERKYKKYDTLKVPQLVSVNTQVDIFPKQKKYSVVARNLIANKSSTVMHEIFVTAPLPLDSISFEGASLVFQDTKLNTYLFALDAPWLPNQEMEMTYNLAVAAGDFKINNSISTNGSYIKTHQFSPYLGYVNQFEIEGAYEREERGLPARAEETVSDDHLHLDGKFNINDVKFETIISTSSDQLAFSSGALVKQWKAKDRNHFHFKSTGKIDNMAAYFSARYAVEKVTHRGVAIELYYHPDHGRNVAEMIKVTKAAIDYCTDNFGDYPHEYLRIGEMSVFGGSNGQAMPGVISINEKVFKKNIEDPEAFNVIARVLVHEVAHQWWGFLLTPKRTDGFMVLGESLAKYSEAVILEKLYGQAMVRPLAEYTVRRYFSGRSYASEKEPALYLTKHQQYLAYSKGAIVMSAIKDLIGEATLNTVLRNLIAKYHHAPVATTLDFLEELYAVVPTDQHQLIDDWMKRVITYDLAVASSSYQPLDDGTYEVVVHVTGARFETDENDEPLEIGINEPIMIGVFSTHPKNMNDQAGALYLKPHQITQNEMTFKLIVDKVPAYISIDPFHTRLDRNALDNTQVISIN